jgi:hypothetical protein
MQALFHSLHRRRGGIGELLLAVRVGRVGVIAAADGAGQAWPGGGEQGRGANSPGCTCPLLSFAAFLALVESI